MYSVTRLPLFFWLLLPFLFITVVMGMLLWFVFNPALQRSSDVSLNAAQDVVKATGNAALAYPLTTLNTEELDSVLVSLINNDMVFAVEVYDTEGNLISRRQNPDVPKEQGIRIFEHRETVFLSEYSGSGIAGGMPIPHDPVPVGEVLYQLTPYTLSRELERYRKELMLGLGILILSIVGILVIYIQHGERPLKDILGVLALIANDQRGVKVESTSSVSELAELITGINFMSAAVDTSSAQVARALDKTNIALESAESAERETREFFSVAAREIAQPVRRLVDFLRILVRKENQSTHKSHGSEIAIALESAEALLTTVDGILDRLNEESHSGNRSMTVRVADYFEKLESAQYARFEAKGLNFTIASNCEPGCDELKVDIRALSVIMDKVLDNALHYTNSGAVHVVWSLVETAGGEARLEVVVRDSGIGIGDREIDSVFDKYFRSKHNHVQAIEGSGLGLYIAQTVAENAGGSLTADSKIGIGSKFVLQLPVEVVSKTAMGPDKHSVGLVALVADPSPLEGTVLGKLLSEARVTTVRVDSSIEALMDLGEYAVDIAFLSEDLSDPDTDELARRIRSKYPNTRVEVITSGGQLQSYPPSREFPELSINRTSIEKIVAEVRDSVSRNIVDFTMIERLREQRKDNSA